MASARDQKIVRAVTQYWQEADQAKQERMAMNRKNYDFYHMKQDVSHKLKGQSKEFLPRQSMAVEQVSQFLIQGLVDFDDFFSVEPKDGAKKPLFNRNEAKSLMKHQLQKAGFYNHTLDALKAGLLGSLIIGKVHGKRVDSPVFTAASDPMDKKKKVLKREDRKSWELCLEVVRQKSWYPDPSNDGLFRVEEIHMDLWELERLAKENPGQFEADAIKQLRSSAMGNSALDDTEKARETNQVPTNSRSRFRVKLWQAWGNLGQLH
jgi:hypothetical protein